MYLNRIGSIQKRIKISIFSKKKNYLVIMVLLLLTKTKTFLKLITNDLIYVYIMLNLGHSYPLI